MTFGINGGLAFRTINQSSLSTPCYQLVLGAFRRDETTMFLIKKKKKKAHNFYIVRSIDRRPQIETVKTFFKKN